MAESEVFYDRQGQRDKLWEPSGSALDEVQKAEVNLAYLAGLADCLLILDRLELFQL